MYLSIHLCLSLCTESHLHVSYANKMTQTNSKGSAVDDLMLTLVNKTFHCRIHRKRIPKFEHIKTERSNLCLRIECMYMCIYIYVYSYVYINIFTYVCINIYIYHESPYLLIWRFWLLASSPRSVQNFHKLEHETAPGRWV